MSIKAQRFSKKDDVFTPNATFTEKPRSGSHEIVLDLKWFLNEVVRDEHGDILRPAPTIVIEGEHGNGKTAHIKASLAKSGVEICYVSGATLLPVDMVMTMPKLASALADGTATSGEVTHAKYVLDAYLSARLDRDGREFVFVVDEVNRIQPATMPTYMEMFQSHRVAGIPIPGLLGIIGIRNPAGSGYLGTNVGDMAFESRFPVFEYAARDIPWMEALAAQYSEVDLTGVFEVWKSLDGTARRVFCPRVVDHVIGVTLEGLPSSCGIPIMPSGRQKILTASGDDITESTLRKIASALGHPYRETIENLVQVAARISASNGWGLRLVGPHGIGKTGLLDGIGPEIGAEMRITSGPNMDPSTLVMLLPDMETGKVEPVLSAKVSSKGEKFILVVDEMTLAPKTVASQLLEVTQERSIAGEPLEGCIAVWALDNPSRFGGIQYKSRSADEAMVSRFHVNLEVTEEDIDWRGYLEARYGAEVVKPFAEWRSQDLNPDERPLVPPRVIETMIRLHGGGRNVDKALPKLGKDRIPVRTHLLKARLGNREVLGLSAIIADKDRFIGILADKSSDEVEQANVGTAVSRAFQKADLPELEPHRDAIIEFLRVLPVDMKVAIMQFSMTEKSSSKKEFWISVYKEILPNQK